MPPEAVPSNASVASTGLGIRYVGEEWAYAFSGRVDVPNVETSLLDFTSGAGIIVGFFNSLIGFSGNVNDDFLWKVYMNDIEVIALNATSAKDLDLNRIDILIPPFTHVKVIAVNASSSTPRAVGGNITGRVYGAE